MPAVSLSPIGNGFQFFDNNGRPLNNGKINTYAAGSTTPLSTYTTIAGNITNDNPIRTDASGRLANEIWLIQGNAYDFQLTDADDNILGTYEDLSGINDLGSVSFTDVTISNDLTVGGDTVIEGNLTVEGTSTFEDIVINGNTTYGTDATITNFPDNTIEFSDLTTNLQNFLLSLGSASSGGASISSGDGRLSLDPDARIMTQDYTGVASIYYVGGLILTLNNGTGVFSAFNIGKLSQALSDTIYSPAASEADKNYDVFGGKYTLSITSMVRSGTTVTVVTSANHNITTDAVVFIAGANQSDYNGYHTLTSGSTDTFTFEIATTPVSPATGTITAATARITRGPFWISDTDRGTGAGTTEIELIENTYVNAVDITNGPLAHMGTYLGTIRTNSSNLLDWLMGGSGAGGSPAWLSVWNVSNRVAVGIRVTDTSASWTYNSATYIPWNSSTNNRFTFVRGLDEDSWQIIFTSYLATDPSPTGTASGIITWGLDSTSSPATDALLARIAMSGAAAKSIGTFVLSYYLGLPGQGFHYLQTLQSVDNQTMLIGGGGFAGLVNM